MYTNSYRQNSDMDDPQAQVDDGWLNDMLDDLEAGAGAEVEDTDKIITTECRGSRNA